MKFDPVTEYSLTELSEPEARPAEPEGGRATEAGDRGQSREEADGGWEVALVGRTC